MKIHEYQAWEILTAGSASRAFALLQERPADLAVLDVEMSVVNGLQLLALLKRVLPARPPAVQVVSPSACEAPPRETNARTAKMTDARFISLSFV